MQLSNKSLICIYVKHILVALKALIERGEQKCRAITLSPLPGEYLQVTGMQYKQVTASNVTLVFAESEGRNCLELWKHKIFSLAFVTWAKISHPDL